VTHYNTFGYREDMYQRMIKCVLEEE